MGKDNVVIKPSNFFTQEQWVDGLIEAWKLDRSITWALLSASNNLLASKLNLLTHDDWVEMRYQITKHYPSTSEHAPHWRKVRIFIGGKCMKASEALFSGDFEKAKRILMSKKDHPAYRTQEFKRAYADQNKKFGINSKAMNQKHTDWKTCK